MTLTRTESIFVDKEINEMECSRAEKAHLKHRIDFGIASLRPLLRRANLSGNQLDQIVMQNIKNAIQGHEIRVQEILLSSQELSRIDEAFDEMEWSDAKKAKEKSRLIVGTMAIRAQLLVNVSLGSAQIADMTEQLLEGEILQIQFEKTATDSIIDHIRKVLGGIAIGTLATMDWKAIRELIRRIFGGGGAIAGIPFGSV